MHIVFCESKYYNPSTIVSQFNNAHVIVYPVNNMYRIQMYYKAGGSWGPLQNEMIVSQKDIGQWVRDTVIHLDRATVLRFTTEKLMNQHVTRYSTIEEVIRLSENPEVDLLHLIDTLKDILQE